MEIAQDYMLKIYTTAREAEKAAEKRAAINGGRVALSAGTRADDMTRTYMVFDQLGKFEIFSGGPDVRSARA